MAVPMGLPLSSISSVLVLLLAALVLHESASVADGAAASSPSAALVNKTCKAYTNETQLYEECIRIFNSSPETKNITDVRDLVFVAGHLAIANFEGTLSSMKELIRNSHSCIKIYTEMNYELGTTLNWIKAGNRTGVGSALSEFAKKPGDCDIVQSKNTYGKRPFLDHDMDALFMVRLVSGLFASVYGKPLAGGRAK